MKPAYVLRWKSPAMSAPAFWYFATREHAEREREQFRSVIVASVEETQVADDFELEDEEPQHEA